MLDVRPVTGVIGAELSGVDLRRPIDGDTVTAIRGALLEHQVIFFRDQDITEEQQMRFAECFGTPMLSVYDTLTAEQPKITVLDTDAPKGRGTDRWHADHTFSDCPPLGAILRAVEVPSSGGDTCFASAGAAYEALSPTLRAFLDTLTAIHTTGCCMGGCSPRRTTPVILATMASTSSVVWMAVSVSRNARSVGDSAS